MARISHKLKNSFEGALAGGGDPATSPLYVFGPFLSLIVVSGAAKVVFGGAVWLAVLTIAVVSAMYRLVMKWVTDGSGGSGLSEEEFGGWAVKVNAAITFIEYTLTFLVSMAAMVTFIADRFPTLNGQVLGLPYRTLVAIALSVFTGWLVNRGPKMAARTFGPATGGVLVLLWLMILSTLIKTGLHLPVLSVEAFLPPNLHFTVGGFVRILAVMTGVEVFANLVAAFDGTPQQKSSKAFQSLLIIMITTAATMLIVGPAIFTLSDPTNTSVSVFTQTMDQLLPPPLPYLGSLVGIIVLMSASAASAQGLQNLALGLKERHYIPPTFGALNPYEVANKPVWLQVGIVSFCFLLFGTHEETYLALYAAGVFILLSMTGWAVTHRLMREYFEKRSVGKIGTIIGTTIGALLTTAATLIIFEERFFEGAWAYFIMVPILYLAFTYFRKKIGAPSPEMDYLGQINSALLAGFGFGQAPDQGQTIANGEQLPKKLQWEPEPIPHQLALAQQRDIHHVMVLLDGSEYAAQALPVAQFVCETTGAQLTLLTASRAFQSEGENKEAAEDYLCSIAEKIHATGIQVNCEVRSGSPAEVARQLVVEKEIDLVVVTTHGRSGEKNWLQAGLSSKLVRLLDIPVLLVQVFDSGPSEAPHFARILVALDGSAFAEQLLPYARFLAKQFDCELMLISVPAVPESGKYRAPASVMQTIRKQAEEGMRKYLTAVAKSMEEEGLAVRTIVTGSYPARTIVDVGKREGVDLIMVTSQGRGGLDLIFMGSVAQQVVQLSDSPVFILPINNELS
ncbi:MAG: universal stress protein [Anaerolineaceae bacterium]|nr:universal stress protein [Anaerolineaceae bacterium]